MNINHDEKTPKALTILKYIEANPACNSAQISHATGIESPRSYIKAHISRGAVVVAGENRKDMKMRLAADRTAEAIYGNGYTKAKPAPSAALLAEVQAAHADVELADADAAPTYEIPAFLRKSLEKQPVEPAPVVKFDTDLGFYADTVLKTKTNPPSQDDFAIDAINTLFDLLPPQSAIVIGRANGELQIEIEADVFGTPVAKTVLINQVIETLNALHIVTVDMA